MHPTGRYCLKVRSNRLVDVYVLAYTVQIQTRRLFPNKLYCILMQSWVSAHLLYTLTVVEEKNIKNNGIAVDIIKILSAERIYICLQDCSTAVGLEDRRIADHQVTASTFREGHCPPNGRLNNKTNRTLKNCIWGAWCSDELDPNPYLQVGVCYWFRVLLVRLTRLIACNLTSAVSLTKIAVCLAKYYTLK